MSVPLSITFLQDRDGNKKEKKVKEQEKKEKDMIIFQEMITIPNQEEIDELVEGNLELKPQVHTTLEKFEKRSFISTVSPIVHTNPSRKLSFLKTVFKPEEFENAGFGFECGKKTSKRELFENNDVTIIT